MSKRLMFNKMYMVKVVTTLKRLKNNERQQNESGRCFGT
jgi:hypothetical protein